MLRKSDPAADGRLRRLLAAGEYHLLAGTTLGFIGDRFPSRQAAVCISVSQSLLSPHLSFLRHLAD